MAQRDTSRGGNGKNGKSVRPGDRGYPRPQFVRDEWHSLDGEWDFGIDADGVLTSPSQVEWKEKIRVPFAPEAPASGVGRTDFFRACWYRRTFTPPALDTRERIVVHFGAVDYAADVWVEGVHCGHHAGGYTPFTVDITDFLSGTDPHEIVVRAEDDPHDLGKPRGKQDWELEPHSIWYPRTTGIWQTVWIEKLPAVRLGDLRWTPSLNHWEIGVEFCIEGCHRPGLRVWLRLSVNGTLLAEDAYSVVAHEVHRRVALSDPGIDDSRNDLLWSPESPTLIDAELELRDEHGVMLDRIRSYTALRAVAVQGDQFVLNGRPYPLRLVLDQGYWPETGLTAPSDRALKRDVELARAMGFNGVRKHQKIEDPRYLYWADKLGLLVWEEMPSAYRFTKTSIERLTREWIEALKRDYSHPCIVAWVPFNESWGVPNLPDNAVERHWVHALYHLTKTLDMTRPVIGNDGWESVATDIIGIHDYEWDPDRIRARYESAHDRPRMLTRERPGGRMLVIEASDNIEHPLVLSEFGGIAVGPDRGVDWGYSRCTTNEEFAERYSELLGAVRSLDIFCGFCYTQFADTYQEANGILTADREPKFAIEEIARATTGPRARPLSPGWVDRSSTYPPQDEP